jgi:hypothetical protein
MGLRSIARSVALSVAVSGCGTWVTDTQINPAPRPLVSRGYESVEVFSSTPPARSHVDVALLKAQSNSIVDHRSDDMIHHLRERAAAMGCDAVFLGASQELAPADFLSPGVSAIWATCVVYTQPGDRAVVPPTPPGRRMCVDRTDFDQHRNCILPVGAVSHRDGGG